MRTLSDHIYDLVQNSVNAGSRTIQVVIEENVESNSLRILIKDDGHGIRPDHLGKVKDIFFTTRSHRTRRVGLGLALMETTCQRAGGSVFVTSEYRHGTMVEATMEHDNIDRPPLGDIADMFSSLMLSATENKIMWHLEHGFGGKRYLLRNRSTLNELNILSYSEPGAKEKLYRLVVEKEREIHG